jgi:hypothetical protein
VIGTLSGGWLADHWQRIGTLRLGYGLAGIASGVTLGLATSAGGVAAPLFGLLADTYGLAAALGTIVVFPTLACALTSLLQDPR